MKRLSKKSLALAAAAVFGFSLWAAGKKDSPLPPQEEVPEVEAVTEEVVGETPQNLDPKRVSYNHDIPEGEPIPVKEVWAYVMTNREYQFTNDMPVTDLCYFSADVNSYGEITYIPNPKVFKDYKGRIHLVVTCTGRALTHLSLDPAFGVRQKLLKTIIAAAKNYDGIQIDFENVPARDAANFRTFLSDIRQGIGNEKWLTVALAARTKKISDDIYEYSKIHPLVDRVIIMAYDEHWSTSAAGSVASMAWCENVVKYCKEAIPERKLVMGLPFYGRSWESECYGSAWIFTSVNRIMNENGITLVEREDGVPFWKATIPVEVVCYFEDTYSLVKRCRLYESYKVAKLAFWRVGQEDVSFWPWLKIQE